MTTSTALAVSFDLFETIYGRRSIRNFQPDRVSEGTIHMLLNAAVQAPTAMHEEPWVFVVVQDAVTLKRLSDRAKPILHAAGTTPGFAEHFADPDFNIFYNAGTLIVIGAKPLGPFAGADCWLAAENLMLAAHGLGLGTCCIGLALEVLNAPDIKEDLRLPADVTAIAAIVVGVPASLPVMSARKPPAILAWR